MSEPTRWLLVACLALSGLSLGCATYDPTELYEGARKGEPRWIHELGEQADPAIPPPGSHKVPRMDEAYTVLRPFLKSDDAFVRLHTLEALRRLITRSAAVFRDRFPDLLDEALADADPEVRWRAAWTLGRAEVKRPALVPLAADEDPRVAERAIWALGQLRDREAIPQFLQALERSETEAAAVRALRRTTRRAELQTADEWRAWGAAGAPKKPTPGGPEQPASRPSKEQPKGDPKRDPPGEPKKTPSDSR